MAMTSHAATGLCLLAPLLFCLPMAAQTPSTTTSPVETRTIDLTKEIPLPGLPPSPILGSRTCSSDGDIYLEMFGATANNVYPDLYRISSQREIKHIARPVPDGFKWIRPMGFFAGESTVVSMISAAGPKDGDPKATPYRYGYVFLSVTDKDGDHGKVIPLDLPFEPIKIAVFDSGEFIILGAARNENRPILALLHDDGTFDRQLDLPTLPQSADEESDQAQDREKWLKERDAFYRLLRPAEFVSYGSEILFVLPDSPSPIDRIRPIGQKEVRVPIPEGWVVQSVLASGPRDTWVIRAQSEADFRKFNEKGIAETPEWRLFEVDPRTGDVMRELLVKGRQPFSVFCAVDGKLTAIDFSGDRQQGAPFRLVYASAPR